MLRNLGRRRSAQLVDFRAPFSPESHGKHATESSGNAPPESNRPPSSQFPTRSRNPDFRISPTMSPEIADFRVDPKSGGLWAGRPSNTDPRRPAQSVDFRAPFPPDTLSKTRDGDVRKREASVPKRGVRRFSLLLVAVVIFRRNYGGSLRGASRNCPRLDGLYFSPWTVHVGWRADPRFDASFGPAPVLPT